MKYKLLSVENLTKTNIGDYIQALASAQFLPQIDGFVDREKLADYDGDECKMIMNGWYIHNPKQWPPSDKIIPLFVAVHINKSVADSMLTEDGIAYLKKHEPIGCRDYYTRDLLLKRGIDAYFSGCMTLTLGYKYKQEQRGKDVYFVDPYVSGEKSIKFVIKDLTTFISNPLLTLKISKKQKVGSNYLSNLILTARFIRLYSKIFTKNTLKNAKYISQENTYYSSLSNEENMIEAEKLVNLYAKAAFVVTIRIHCALPSTGLGTPVYYTQRLNEDEISSCRFGGLTDLFNKVLVGSDSIECQFYNGMKLSLDNILPNKDGWKELAKKLSERCSNFIRE